MKRNTRLRTSLLWLGLTPIWALVSLLGESAIAQVPDPILAQPSLVPPSLLHRLIQVAQAHSASLYASKQTLSGNKLENKLENKSGQESASQAANRSGDGSGTRPENQVGNPDEHPAVGPAESPGPALQPGEVRILTPTPNSVLDLAAATVVVQYHQGGTLDLRVNDIPVPANLIGRTETDSDRKIVTQTFYGVPLKDGNNRLTAQMLAGKVAGGPAIQVSLQVRGAAKEMRIKFVESRIPADGRSTATLQGQLWDDHGNRSNRDAIITLHSDAGDFIGADADLDQPGFQVKAIAGQFTASLRAGLAAKPVTVRASTGTLEAFTQLNFETNLRTSIATGMISLRLGARGTNFYDSFRNFLPADGKTGTDFDVKSAVFATGRMGEWLFSGAYNSDRPLNQTCDGTTSLFRATQSCDQTYPVYGDSSTAAVLTPSTDHVFVRLERTSKVPDAGTDYAMWGDYNTEEFAGKAQQFTAISRQLHGFKANYNLGALQVTGFYGNNVQGFQRDTIPPDGTSGYYFLSRRTLVEGSENVFLETEELNRPGTVIDRQQLSRGPDYEIDYDRGSLLFHQPVLRTDLSNTGAVLVRRIVVTYQYDTPGSNNSIYAGRVKYNFSRRPGQESFLGATYVKEAQGVRQFELYGADAYFTLGDNSHLLAEYAHSTNDSDLLSNITGSAYRLELEGLIAKGITGRAFYNAADTGFANNATISFVPGQRRYGGQVIAAISPTTNLRLQYDHEDNQGIAPRPLVTLGDLLDTGTGAVPGSQVDNSLTTISAGIQQRLGRADLAVDWLHRDRTDRLTPNALSSTSDQLRSRLTLPLSPQLTFQAQNETTLSSQTDAVYSDSTLLGLNWQAMPGVNVQLAQQFYSRGQLAGQSYTSLNVLGDYKLGPSTNLTGRYSILGGANQMTMQGALGLTQKIKLSPGLKMDLSYEHIFSTFSRTAAGSRFAQPYAVGQSASALGLDGGDNFSIGIDYTDNAKFNASARFEHRSSGSGSNNVISAAAAGKLSPSLTALMHYQQANASNQTLVGLGDTATLKLGLAYRDPNSDKFNALLRYEYRKNPAVTPDTVLLGSGTGSKDHLFALEAIYAPDWRWEFYGKFALRSSTSYLASDLVGTSTITLAQARATYRFGYKWDIAGEARWINQPSSDYSETGFVAELGYYLTPNLRLAAGYSFGRASDRDFNGYRSAGGPYLGLTIKLNELFDGFGLQKVAPPQQQESQVKPVAAVTKD